MSLNTTCTDDELVLVITKDDFPLTCSEVGGSKGQVQAIAKQEWYSMFGCRLRGGNG